MVKLINVVKSYEGESELAVKNLSLEINAGEFLTILGPSGCGKTTTLKMIGGFLSSDSGQIIINNIDVTKKQPYDRNVNTVFQNYALFPHMSIFQNIAYGLTVKKLAKAEIKEKVEAILKVVQLEGYENKMPDQLSGGQKQRVAIARAIVNNPSVLLLDEPLGALDLKLRKQMQVELKHLQQKLGITFVFVTHDQEEALTMSDRIVVMNDGVIAQMGTPKEIYERPKTRFVADFIGETNLFEAVVSEVSETIAMLKLDEATFIKAMNENLKVGDKVSLAIRPEKLTISEEKSENLKNVTLPVVVKEQIYVGSTIRTITEMSDGRVITINTLPSSTKSFVAGEKAYATWEISEAVVIQE